MMSLLRTIVFLAVLATLITCGATVPLGNRTFFEHVGRIWAAQETQEMVEGVKDKSGPLVEKVKRGVHAGVEAATGEDAGPPDDKPKNDGAGDGSAPPQEPAKP